MNICITHIYIYTWTLYIFKFKYMCVYAYINILNKIMNPFSRNKENEKFGELPSWIYVKLYH